MTMMITKFHRLIQSKLVWIVFCFLIVVSFVFWGMQAPSGDDLRLNEAVATLDGKPVTSEEFSQARFGAYFSLVLQSGQQLPNIPDLDSRIRSNAWKRLISLKQAESMRLVAGNEETRSNLETTPFLSPNGTYDPQQYDALINRAIPELLGGRLSKSQFENHIRQEISLEKLNRMVAHTVAVSPFDVERIFHSLNDEYIIDYTSITSSNVENSVSVSEEQVKAYFDSHPDDFEVSERVAFSYVTISLDPFLQLLEVTDEKINEYYQAHLDDYRFIASNEVPVSIDGLTNEEFSAAAAITYRPIEEVRDGIIDLLKRETARFKAVEVANDLVYGLTPDQFGKAPSFAELTKSMELSVAEAGPFTRDQPAKSLGKDANIILEQAFQLYQNPDEYYSNPIDGGDQVYVLALKERLPPHVPTFEDVADQVRSEALRDAIIKATYEKGRKLKTDFESASAETSFADMIEAAGLISTNAGPISQQSPLDSLPSGGAVVEALSTLNQGEVSDPIEIEDGVLVAYVRERIDANPEDLPSNLRSLTQGIQQQYVAALFDGWQGQLLKDAGFQERERYDPAPSPETESNSDGS